MQKPTFIIIGPGRTGTSWMYEILLEHPEVCMASGTKETHFFDKHYQKGEDWYFKFFRNCHSSKAAGEISNLYFYDDAVPERIYNLLPDVRLITCLRDPLDRMASAYLYRVRSGEVEGTFEEALEKQPTLLTDNYYYTLLSNYLKFFNTEQITILFYEDLKNNPGNFAKELYSAIGVDTGFVPESLHKAVNRSNKARLNLFAHVVDAGSGILRKMQLYSLLNALKRNQLIRKLLFREIERDNNQIIPLETRKFLMDKLESEIEGVEQLTGKELSQWKKIKG